MSIAICTNGRDGFPHCPLELIAGSVDEETVQARQDARGYEVTSVRYDGVRGVSDEARDSAECDDSPMCVECRTEIDHWDHEEGC